MAQSGTVVAGINVEMAGVRAFDPNPVTAGVAQNKGSDSQHSITASTVQTQVGAMATAQLIAGMNQIEVCANGSDSVALPTMQPGDKVWIMNNGAQTCKMFGNSAVAQTINGTAGATGVTGPAAGKLSLAMCLEANKILLFNFA